MASKKKTLTKPELDWQIQFGDMISTDLYCCLRGFFYFLSEIGLPSKEYRAEVELHRSAAQESVQEHSVGVFYIEECLILISTSITEGESQTQTKLSHSHRLPGKHLHRSLSIYQMLGRSTGFNLSLMVHKFDFLTNITKICTYTLLKSFVSYPLISLTSL